MFREMRRKKQMLSMDECIEILNKGTSGVLALLGDHDYPRSEEHTSELQSHLT